jgi:hypothetical protein
MNATGLVVFLALVTSYAAWCCIRRGMNPTDIELFILPRCRCQVTARRLDFLGAAFAGSAARSARPPAGTAQYRSTESRCLWGRRGAGVHGCDERPRITALILVAGVYDLGTGYPIGDPGSTPIVSVRRP